VDNEDLVLAFEFGGEEEFGVGGGGAVELGRVGLEGLLEVELALIHKDLEGRELVLAEVHGRVREVLVDGLGEEGDVTVGVYADAVHEGGFFG